jgi:hypothetical protein
MLVKAAATTEDGTAAATDNQQDSVADRSKEETVKTEILFHNLI